MEQSIKIGNIDLATLSGEKEDALFAALKMRIENRQADNTGYVIVRSGQAGVFFGQLVAVSNGVVRLDKCRRIWYWKGANTCSQLALEGTDSSENKFSGETDNHIVLGVCEIIQCTDVAVKKIKSVKLWKA